MWLSTWPGFCHKEVIHPSKWRNFPFSFIPHRWRENVARTHSILVLKPPYTSPTTKTGNIEHYFHLNLQNKQKYTIKQLFSYVRCNHLLVCLTFHEVSTKIVSLHFSIFHNNNHSKYSYLPRFEVSVKL